MSKQKNCISVRFNDEELEYLTQRAKKNKILKSNKTPSIGLAIKRIIRDEMTNKLEQNDDISNKISYLETLVEQINVAIPHLVYNTNFTHQFAAKNMESKVEFCKIKEKSLSFTNEICGKIQEQKYKNIYISKDKNGMSIMPIEDDESAWK
jgi:hypothetical protein